MNGSGNAGIAGTADHAPGQAPPGVLSVWLQLREGEERPVLGLMALSLLLGLIGAVYFVVATVLVVAPGVGDVWPDDLATRLPWLYVASGLCAALARGLLAALERRLGFARLAAAVLGLSLLLCVGWLLAEESLVGGEDFWWMVAAPMFVTVMPVLAALEFVTQGSAWRALDVEQLGRLGRALRRSAAAGATLGFAAAAMHGYAGDFEQGMPSTLVLAVVALALAAWPLRALARRRPEAFAGRLPPPAVGEESPESASSRRHAPLLGATTALVLLVHYLVDFGFLVGFASATYLHALPTLESMGLLASFFLALKLVEAAVDALTAGPLARRFGPGAGIVVLPAAMLACVAAALLLAHALDLWSVLDLLQRAQDSDPGSETDFLWRNPEFHFWLLLLALPKLVESALRGALFEPAVTVLAQPLGKPADAWKGRILAYGVQPVALLLAALVLHASSTLFIWGTWSQQLLAHLQWLLSPALLVLLVCAALVLRRHHRSLLSGFVRASTRGVGSIRLLALFVSELLDTGRMDRGRAFALIEKLPGDGPFARIRAAAGRCAIGELKKEIARAAEAAACASGGTGGTRPAPALMGVAPVPVRRGPASFLCLLRDLHYPWPGPQQSTQEPAAPSGERSPLLALSATAFFFALFSALYFLVATAGVVATMASYGSGLTLPWLFMGTGLAGLLARWLFSLLERRVGFGRLAAGTTALVLLTGLGFAFAWVLTAPGDYVLASAMFIGLMPVLGLLDLAFRGTAARALEPGQRWRYARALRLATQAGATTGFALGVFAAVLELGGEDLVSGLLMIVAETGLALAMVPFFGLAWRRSGAPVDRAAGPEEPAPAAQPAPRRPAGPGPVLLFAVVTALAYFTHYFIELGLLGFAAQPGALEGNPVEALALLGLVYLLMRLSEAMFDAFAARRLWRRLGPAGGLATLPVALLAYLVVAAFAFDPSDEFLFWLLLLAVPRLLESLVRRLVFEPSLVELVQPLASGRQGGFVHLIQPLAIVTAGLALVLVDAGRAGTDQISLEQMWSSIFAVQLPALVALLACALLALRLHRRRVAVQAAPTSGEPGARFAPVGHGDEVASSLRWLAECGRVAPAAALTPCGPAPAPQPHDPANPFPGLRPFEQEEAEIFFGRGPHTDELLRKLQRSRFVAVVGTSGSGKSSLVRAGLLPALRGDRPGRAGARWRIALLRPGSDPIGELARALIAPGVLGAPAVAGGADDGENGTKLQETLAETTLRRSALGLVEAVGHAHLEDGERLLVVVDQFEELFRFKREAGGRHGAEDSAAFVKLLLEASRSSSAQVYVVLTMRSDYLGDCTQFRDLPEAVNDGQYLIPRLTRDQRRDTIVRPVEVAHGAIAPRLVQRLLNDVGDNPDQLPILQHALMRSWDYWAAVRTGDQPLDIEHYEHVGRMASALSRHADEVYLGLPDDRARHTAERVFRALVTDKRADGRGVRRPTPLEELWRGAEASRTKIELVIDAFRRPGCSLLMPPAEVALAPDTVIDISHESLMRVWERLREWTDHESDSARSYRRLAETAVDHREQKAALWSDPDLSRALSWRALERPNATWALRHHPEFACAMRFLDASEQAQHQLRRRRAGLGAAGGALLAAIAVAGVVIHRQGEIKEQVIRAFEDLDTVSRIETDCRILFSPKEVKTAATSSGDPGPVWPEKAVAKCGKALEHVRELVDGLAGHRKTHEDLEADPDRYPSAGLAMTTAKSLLAKLEVFTVLKQAVSAGRGHSGAGFASTEDRDWKADVGGFIKDRMKAPRGCGEWKDAPQVAARAGICFIGRDPSSGRPEFAHLLSGEVPVRTDGELELNGKTGIVLVLVPAGDAAGNGDAARPTQPYFLAKHPLTRGQWCRLTGQSEACKADGEDQARAMVEVSFEAASRAGTWLGLRLPTESEWVNAVRAGSAGAAGDDASRCNALGLCAGVDVLSEWTGTCHEHADGSPDCEWRIVRGVGPRGDTASQVKDRDYWHLGYFSEVLGVRLAQDY